MNTKIEKFEEKTRQITSCGKVSIYMPGMQNEERKRNMAVLAP